LQNQFICPICDSTEFGDFRGRKKIRCAGCGSFERSRFLWTILSKLQMEKLDSKILHLAPEVGIANKLTEKYGDMYLAADYDPAIYSKSKFDVTKIDLCNDLDKFEDNSFSAIIHVHVLEHVRCNVSYVMQELNRVIAPNGYHIIGLPFMDGYYKEDLSPTLSEEYRLKEFGHEDHVRAFGVEDWELLFSPFFKNFELIPLNSFCSKSELSRYRIPVIAATKLTGHSINVYKKII
jgi:SAM-dependent methyltransferase